MRVNSKFNNQEGYSIIEMMIAATVMLICTAAVVALLKNSIFVATASYELTDAQESLRTAQEYINRDLMNAGDGLKSITYIPVNTTFMTGYLTRSPITDATAPSNATLLGIVTTDNNVPTGKSVPGPPLPGASPSPTPPPVSLLAGADRHTLLEIDPDLVANPQYSPAISIDGDIITLPAAMTTADVNNKFKVGEIYFLSSLRGGTFGAITKVDGTNKKLEFKTGDYCGLNNSATTNRIKDISVNGTLPTTMQRIKIIHYFVDGSKLLKRRVFGESGVPFRDTIIAEHVLNVQFVYSLGLDVNGDPVQPTNLLTTPLEQVNISQVQVTVTVETPHALNQGLNQVLSTTTSTSLRNMQFRQALQPKPSPSP